MCRLARASWPTATAKEYEETYNKARALQQAIRMAADGLL